jgi:hypothetical protein
MRNAGCPQENAVARAVRSGVWNQSLEAHVRECETCSGVRNAALWMQKLVSSEKASAQAASNLPDPRIVWLRAQIGERRVAAERAQKIAQWLEIGCTMIFCAGAGIWVAWNWGAVGGAIGDAFDWFALEAWPAFWLGLYAYGPANAPLLFSLALTVIAAITVGLAYPLLLRE